MRRWLHSALQNGGYIEHEGYGNKHWSIIVYSQFWLLSLIHNLCVATNLASGFLS